MKRWAILTVAIYALALLLLTAPTLFIAFARWGIKDISGITGKDILTLYKSWGYWIWLAVLLGGQFLLLLVPIDISEKRLPSRRKLKVPIIVAGFFLANLTFAGFLAIFCGVFKEEGFGIFGFLTPFKAGEVQPSDDQTVAGMIVTVLVFWFIWSAIFRNCARVDSPDGLLKRASRWLLRGSILELIIAVPSHVIVRRREDCCAPAGTFWGIATGISVMLLCFGPGVYFLFVERMQRLKPKENSEK